MLNGRAGAGVTATGFSVAAGCAGGATAAGLTGATTTGIADADGLAVAAGDGFTVAAGDGFAVPDAAGDGVADAPALGEADGDAAALGVADAAAVGEGEGFALGVGAGDGVTVGAGDGDGARVTSGDGLTCGTGVTTGTDAGPLFGPLSRFWNAETSAPIPRPAITTPIAKATVGNGPPPFPLPPLLPPELPRRDAGGGVGRRRGEGSDIASRFPRIRQEALPRQANAPSMIRVRVPIDVNAVLCADSTAFALATPLRVGELLTHAILEALGPRAPQDKRERAIAVAHAGLNDGAFILQIDERIYEHCDDVAVVAGIVAVRFFRRQHRSNAA